MSLPVIRLNVVDAHRIVSVSDPKFANFTLYSFLKVVATQADSELTFLDFCKQIKAANAGEGMSSRYGLSRDAFRTPASARLVQSLEAASSRVFSQPAPRGLHPMTFETDAYGGRADGPEAQQRRQKLITSFFESGPSKVPSNSPSTFGTTYKYQETASSPVATPSPLAATNRPTLAAEADQTPRRTLTYSNNEHQVTSPFAHHSAAYGTDVLSNKYEDHLLPTSPKPDGLTIRRENQNDDAAIISSIGRRPPAATASHQEDSERYANKMGHSSQHSTYLARTLRDVHDMSSRESLSSKDLSDRNVREIRNNNIIDLFSRIASVKEKGSDGVEGNEHSSDPNLIAAICDSLTARVRNVQMFQLLQQHEEETLKIADLALRTECEAMKRQLKDAISALVRSEGRLTGEDESLPPSDGRYVAEHFLFEQIQDVLQEASNIVWGTML